jgi:hypothetical protein
MLRGSEERVHNSTAALRLVQCCCPSTLQRSSLVVLRGTLRAAAHASHLPTSGGAPDPARRRSDDSKDAGGFKV